MKNLFLLAFTLCLLALMVSCQSRMICPAFQSSFIYDDQERKEFFAYFEDSIPVDRNYISKNKFGIMEEVGRNKREGQLSTVKMEIIFPANSDDSTHIDSTLVAVNDLSGLKANQIDSVNNDQPKNYYNVEQDTYMKLFGEYLSFPESPSEKEITTEEANQKDLPDLSSMSRKERRNAERAERKRRKEVEKLADPKADALEGDNGS